VDESTNEMREIVVQRNQTTRTDFRNRSHMLAQNRMENKKLAGTVFHMALTMYK